VDTATQQARALARATAEALSAHGPVAAQDPAFIERDAQQAMAAAVAQAIERREPLVAEAGTGVGKTFVAQALGVQACRAGRRVLFTKTSALLADLAGGRADATWQGRLRRYVGPDLLILDDFALREYTAPQAEDLYELVSRRYRHGSTIVE